MTQIDDDARRRMLAQAFAMPKPQTPGSRKSSITNAFVYSLIPPGIQPSHEEIERALAILEIDIADVRCAYCGDKSTEWDHLRPLVVDRRPTGFISEIANLVPSCSKCNQSKGNKPWRKWMEGQARQSPTGRSLPDVAERIQRLHAYEQWREPTHVDLEGLIGKQDWDHYWSLCENIISELQRCQDIGNALRARVIEQLKS